MLPLGKGRSDSSTYKEGLKNTNGKAAGIRGVAVTAVAGGEDVWLRGGGSSGEFWGRRTGTS